MKRLINLLTRDAVTKEAINAVETSGIVFLDEFDKVCAKPMLVGGDVSR